MKELQPKLAELKKKFGNDREKFARAQMELFQQNNYNPLSGCLPVFIQLPIFMGLYQALNSSVDLRMAPFLWFNNLAAPDKLVQLPIQIPVIAQFFNLLPIITVSLFVVQQKMFMPPPADEQQEMQYKMMNYMMVFMGAMFYHVPAGLCVYFIASSLWGMAERKLLDITAKKPRTTTPPPEEDTGGKGGGSPRPSPSSGKPGLAAGIWRKLLETADAAGSQTAVKERTDEASQNGGKKKDRKTRR
jgi:YidC/Oxa1 family membrane protein insertase